MEYSEETNSKEEAGLSAEFETDIRRHPVLKQLCEELKTLDASLLGLLKGRNSAARLLEHLPRHYTADQVAVEGPYQRAWEIVGLIHLNTGRVHEALAIFWQLYQHMLSAPESVPVHKGMPLVWIGDCFAQLNFTVHAKRYLMLTLVEDVLRDGFISPDTTGTYFRLAWGHGLLDQELHRYGSLFLELAQQNPEEAIFPEALLQHVDDDWLTEFPSATEASSYRVNPLYVRHLLAQLGSGTGRNLKC